MRPTRLAPLAALLVLVACSGTPTAQPTPTRTLVPTVTRSASPTLSPTPSRTPSATPRPTPTRTRAHSPRPSPTQPSPTRSPSRSPRPTYSPRPSPRPLPPGDHSLFVLGDSVLISAETAVRSALHGWEVTYDAVGSRRLPQGIQVLRARRAEIGRVVVIQQGNNYIAAEGDFGDQIDQAMRVLRGTSRVVWLTVAEKWPSRVMINREIRAAAGRWPTIVVGDWARVVAAHPEYAGDQLHLSPDGRRAIARLIASCVGPA